MVDRRNRRQYLSGLVAVSATAFAGCSSNDASSQMPTTTATETAATETAATSARTLDWARWLPNAYTESGVPFFSLDLRRLREGVPTVGEPFPLSEFAEYFGVTEAAFETFSGFNLPPSLDNVELFTGSFTPADILSHLEVPDSAITESDDHFIISDVFAVSEQTLLLDGFDTGLETRFGDRTSFLDGDERWRTLLDSLKGGILIEAARSFANDEMLSGLVEMGGFRIDPTDDGARHTWYLLFDSSSSASDAMDTHGDAIQTAANYYNGTVTAFEQDGTTVTLTIAIDSFYLYGGHIPSF